MNRQLLACTLLFLIESNKSYLYKLFIVSAIQPIYPRIQLHFLTCQIERLYKIRQTFLYKPWAHTSSETQGQIRHCPQGLFSLFFTFLRAIFFRPFRLSLAPTICPWVSEDGAHTTSEKDLMKHIRAL